MTDEETLDELDVVDVRSRLTDGTWDDDLQESFSGAPDSIGEWRWTEPTHVKGLGHVRVIENEGGEGEGERAHMVFEISSDGVTRWFKQTGWYQSYDGFNWDGTFKETYPVVREVTFYD